MKQCIDVSVLSDRTSMGYVNQQAATKFPLDDAMQAILLFCTLPDSWENLALTLSTSCEEENLWL